MKSIRFTLFVVAGALAATLYFSLHTRLRPTATTASTQADPRAVPVLQRVEVNGDTIACPDAISTLGTKRVCTANGGGAHRPPVVAGLNPEPDILPPAASEDLTTVSGLMQAAIASIRRGETGQLLMYVESVRRCMERIRLGYDGDPGCNAATVRAYDKAFLQTASSMADHDVAAAHAALGIWWAQHAVELTLEHSASAANRASNLGAATANADGNDTSAQEPATPADAWRQHVPGYAEAMKEAIIHLTRARDRSPVARARLASLQRNGEQGIAHD